MGEFNIDDYMSARSFADSIQKNADNILDVFNQIDNTMKTMYGTDWQSNGADTSNGRYQELRANYEIFYSNVVAMKEHIYSVTTNVESTDTKVSSDIQSV